MFETKEFDENSVQTNKKQSFINNKYIEESDFYIFFKLEEKKHDLRLIVNFLKHPTNYPLWVIIDVEIQDQKYHFFYEKKDETQISKKSFKFKLTKKILLDSDSKVEYRIRQVPAYICTLSNPGRLCYLNSVIQLLFHLSKFRFLIQSICSTRSAESLLSPYIFKLRNLFDIMASGQSKTSSKELTESFGWPTLALKVPHDSSEFLYCLLDNILNYNLQNNIFKKIRRRFDSCFVSHFQFEDETLNDDSKVDQTELMLLPDYSQNSLLDDIQRYLTKGNIKRTFTSFPEILFVQVNGQYNQYEENLDLSSLSYESDDFTCSKYTLSGLIIRVGVSILGIHYKCVVRANSCGVWHYFNDDVQGCFTTLNEGENIQSILKKISMNSSEPEHIRVLAYIRDDVIEEYFDPVKRVIPLRKQEKKSQSCRTFCTFLVITEDDIISYVNNGRTDFRELKESFTFTLTSTNTKKDVYTTVANHFKVSRNSFILRLAESNVAPSSYQYEDTNTRLGIINKDIQLFYEPTKRRPTAIMTVPLYFLSFEFNPEKFLQNLDHNLNNSFKSRELKNLIMVRSHEPRVGPLKSSAQGSSTHRKKIYENLVDHNDFTYIRSIVLQTDDCLESTIPEILKALKKPANTKISFFVSDFDEITNAQIKEVDSSSPINECFHVATGRYVYVQCHNDNDEREGKDDRIERIVDIKLIFFDFLSRALKKPIFKRSLSNIFMIENFSIPITICKLNGYQSDGKTLLYPLFLPLTLKELYMFVCAVMGDKYDDSMFIQIFLGFRKDFPPFTEPVTSMQNLNRALQYSLLNTEIFPNKVHFSLTDEEFNYDGESDTDFVSNVYFYYQLFEKKNKDQISLRVYLSNDAVKVDFMSQIIFPCGEKVSYLIDNLPKIFPQNNFSDDISKDYLILKISDCKISGIINQDYSPSSNLAIRFDRQPKDYVGFIPVYYGAKYNDTRLIPAFGSPFLVPITQKDLQFKFDSNYSLNFQNNEIYKKITKDTIMNKKKFELYVTNYEGIIIQNIKVWEFEKLLSSNNNTEFKLHIAICIESMNAAAFLDEEKFFKSSIKILT